VHSNLTIILILDPSWTTVIHLQFRDKTVNLYSAFCETPR